MKWGVCAFLICGVSARMSMDPQVVLDILKKTKCLDMLYGSKPLTNVSDVYMLNLQARIQSLCLAITILEIRKKQLAEENPFEDKQDRHSSFYQFTRAIEFLKKHLNFLMDIYRRLRLVIVTTEDESDLTNLLMEAQNDEDS